MLCIMIQHECLHFKFNLGGGQFEILLQGGELSKGGMIRFYKTGLFKVFLKNLKLYPVTNSKSGFLMYSWMYNLQ